jgi:hypothetical protein
VRSEQHVEGVCEEHDVGRGQRRGEVQRGLQLLGQPSPPSAPAEDHQPQIMSDRRLYCSAKSIITAT